MSRITKIELQQALAALGTEVEKLRVENAQLRADNERLSAKAAAPAPAPQREPRIPVGHAREVSLSAWKIAAMQARDLAMRSGRCVKVG